MSKQEAEALATETVKSYKSYDYGIAGDQSHAHGLSTAEYIDNYLESNADGYDYGTLYPYAVNFGELPEEICFYDNDKEKFIVKKNGRQISILESGYNAPATHVKSIREYNGYLKDKATQEFFAYSWEEMFRKTC